MKQVINDLKEYQDDINHLNAIDVDWTQLDREKFPQVTNLLMKRRDEIKKSNIENTFSDKEMVMLKALKNNKKLSNLEPEIHSFLFNDNEYYKTRVALYFSYFIVLLFLILNVVLVALILKIFNFPKMDVVDLFFFVTFWVLLFFNSKILIYVIQLAFPFVKTNKIKNIDKFKLFINSIINNKKLEKDLLDIEQFANHYDYYKERGINILKNTKYFDELLFEDGNCIKDIVKNEYNQTKTVSDELIKDLNNFHETLETTIELFYKNDKTDLQLQVFNKCFNQKDIKQFILLQNNININNNILKNTQVSLIKIINEIKDWNNANPNINISNIDIFEQIKPELEQIHLILNENKGDLFDFYKQINTIVEKINCCKIKLFDMSK